MKNANDSIPDDNNENLSQWEALLGSLPGGMACVRLDKEFSILHATEGFYHLTGYTKQEYHSHPIEGKGLRLIVEEDKESLFQTIKEQFQKSNKVYAEYRIRKKDGSTAWISIYGVLDSVDNNIVQVMFMDNTEVKRTERQLINLTNTIPGGVVKIQVDGEKSKIVYANDGFYEILGYTKEEYEQPPLCGNPLALICPEDIDALRNDMCNIGADKNIFISMEYRVRKKDNSMAWHILNGIRVEDEDGKPCFQLVIIDNTKAKQAQKQLMLEEERFRIVMEQTQDVIVEWDMQTNRVYHSSNFLKRFGYTLPEDDFFSWVEQSSYIHEDDKKTWLEVLEDIRAGKRNSGELDYRIQVKDKSYLWIKLKYKIIFDEKKAPIKLVGMIFDIDSFKRETENLQNQAQRDLLTGLYNKITTQAMIETYLAGKGQKKNHTLFIVDIDDFKKINDNLGHFQGDAVLSDISLVIREHFRDEDIIGRVGGDEFVIFLKEISERDVIVNKAEKIIDVFRRLFTKNTETYKTSCSIGIAVYPNHGETFQELFIHADSALYHAKEQGKDQFYIFGEKPEEGVSLTKRTANTPVDSIINRKDTQNHFAQYLFQVIYNSRDIDMATNIILEIAARYFDISRAYVLELAPAGWWQETYRYDYDGSVDYTDLSELINELGGDKFRACFENKEFICDNLEALSPPIREMFEKLNTKSMLQMPIMDKTELVGYVGFLESRKERAWDKEEVEAGVLISKILGLLLLNQRMSDRLNYYYQDSKLLLDEIGIWNYVIDEDYRLIYMNQKALKRETTLTLGHNCYETIWGVKEPCQDCPMKRLKEGSKIQNLSRYNEKFQIQMNVTAVKVKWVDDKWVYLLLCVDAAD